MSQLAICFPMYTYNHSTWYSYLSFITTWIMYSTCISVCTGMRLTELSRNLTHPKSASLMSPLSSKRMLLHLTSRWMIFLPWRYCKPSSTCLVYLLALISSSLPSFFSTSASDPYRSIAIRIVTSSICEKFTVPPVMVYKLVTCIL